MDVKTFTSELLNSLSETSVFDQISLQSEGPVVSGYAYPSEGNFFLRYYFNEVTGTLAFALVENNERFWGIDFDNRRGWHLHPVEKPADHISIEPITVPEIVTHLQRALLTRNQ